MKIVLFILLGCFLINCKKDNNTLKIGDVENKICSVKSQDSIKILSSIANLSIEKLDVELKTNFFKRDLTFKISQYYKFDNICIYSVSLLDDDLSNNLKKNYVVLDVKTSKTQYIIPLEINQIFNIDKKIMFGGIYNYREYDYYVIYEIKDSKINCTLDTRDINGKPIVIGYYKDDECIDYSPDRLSIYYDIGRKEISFKGTLDNYCKEGADRFENSIVAKKLNTIIYFKYTNSKWNFEKEKSNYFFW